LGGNGQTGREGQLLSIQPQVRRYNFNLLAHFKMSDAFEPFIEAKWNRVDAIGNNASPTGIQGTFGQFDFRERFRIDNPFLTADQRSTIANAILTSGCNTSLTAACATAATATAPAGVANQVNDGRPRHWRPA
jgi:hydrogenase maturation factor